MQRSRGDTCVWAKGWGADIATPHRAACLCEKHQEKCIYELPRKVKIL